MRIAPDVEQMMWMVAESADPQAVADFESRFPALRYELSKRIDMVRKLKASGKAVSTSGSIPRFIPRPQAQNPGAMRARWSVAVVALSALAFGSFYGTKLLLDKPLSPKTTNVVQVSPGTVPKSPPPVDQTPQVPETQAPAGQGLHPPDDEPVSLPKWQAPNSVKFERIGLAMAIRAIAEQCGLTLDMPPDMPNEDIVVHYQNMTGIQMLQDMAPQFGFSVFDQGDGKVLVIPARDETAPSHSASPEIRPLRPGGLDAMTANRG